MMSHDEDSNMKTTTALSLCRLSASTTPSTTNCSRLSLKRRSWWKVTSRGLHPELLSYSMNLKTNIETSPPTSLPPCLFFCSVFLCVAAGHPIAGATLHLQELVVFLCQPVWQRHQSERTNWPTAMLFTSLSLQDHQHFLFFFVLFFTMSEWANSLMLD